MYQNRFHINKNTKFIINNSKKTAACIAFYFPQAQSKDCYGMLINFFRTGHRSHPIMQ